MLSRVCRHAGEPWPEDHRERPGGCPGSSRRHSCSQRRQLCQGTPHTAPASSGTTSSMQRTDIACAQVSWSRAARTDKGVSAVGQLVGLKLLWPHPDMAAAINAHLPPSVRIFGVQRVTGAEHSPWDAHEQYDYDAQGPVPCCCLTPAFQHCIQDCCPRPEVAAEAGVPAHHSQTDAACLPSHQHPLALLALQLGPDCLLHTEHPHSTIPAQ